jgi:hypothetical protein
MILKAGRRPAFLLLFDEKFCQFFNVKVFEKSSLRY